MEQDFGFGRSPLFACSAQLPEVCVRAPCLETLPLQRALHCLLNASLTCVSPSFGDSERLLGRACSLQEHKDVSGTPSRGYRWLRAEAGENKDGEDQLLWREHSQSNRTTEFCFKFSTHLHQPSLYPLPALCSQTHP